MNKKGMSYQDSTSYNGKKITISNIPQIFMAVYLTIIFKPKNFNSCKKIFKHYLIYQLIYKSSSNNRFQIFDEGIFHKIRALKRYSKENSLITLANKVLKYIYPPDVLVILEAKPETIYRRRINRDRKNDVFNYETIVKEARDPAFKQTLKSLYLNNHFYRSKTKVININHDNDKDILKNATSIVEKIELYYQGQVTG